MASTLHFNPSAVTLASEQSEDLKHLEAQTVQERIPASAPQWRGYLERGCKEVIYAPLAAWRDLRSTKWAKHRWLPIALILLFMNILLLLYLINFTINSTIDAPCTPDGALTMFSSTFNWFAMDNFFQITLPIDIIGKLSFTNAKLIDVAWDMVVGRGGQAILVCMSWSVFRNYVALSMMTKPVTFSTYFLIFLQSDPGPLSTFRITKDFASLRALCSKTAMSYMVLAMLFCLGFPVLAGSMTGYTTALDPYVTKSDQTLIPLNELELIAYVIHDAKRINLTDNYAVPFVNSTTCQFHNLAGISDQFSVIRYFVPGSCIGPLVNATSKYVSEYGFSGTNKTVSTWNHVPLPSPSLNITAYYIPPLSMSDLGYTGPDDFFGADKYSDYGQATYLVGGEVQNTTYIKHSSGICQPSRYYQWGFSYLQVMLMVILLFIYLTCTLLMMLNTYFANEALGAEVEVPTGWGAILKLAQAIKRQFMGTGMDVDVLAHSQIHQQVQKSMQGGAIFSLADESPKNRSVFKYFGLWVCKEVGWLLSFGSILGGLISYGLHRAASMEFSEPNGNVYIAMWITGHAMLASLVMLGSIIVGKSACSRVLLFICCATLVGIPTGVGWYYLMEFGSPGWIY